MTFEEIRRRAHGKIGDAQDWLRSDWRDQPTPAQARHVQDAARYLALAKSHLDAAAKR